MKMCVTTKMETICDRRKILIEIEERRGGRGKIDNIYNNFAMIGYWNCPSYSNCVSPTVERSVLHTQKLVCYNYLPDYRSFHCYHKFECIRCYAHFEYSLATKCARYSGYTTVNILRMYFQNLTINASEQSEIRNIKCYQ